MSFKVDQQAWGAVMEIFCCLVGAYLGAMVAMVVYLKVHFLQDEKAVVDNWNEVEVPIIKSIAH